MRFNYERKFIDRSNAYLKCSIIQWAMNFLMDDSSANFKANAIDLIFAHAKTNDIEKLIRGYLDELPRNHPYKKTDVIDEDGDFNSSAYTFVLVQLEQRWCGKPNSKYRKRIFQIAESILNEHAKDAEEDSLKTQLEGLADAFKLTEFEKTAILFFFARNVDGEFSDLCDFGTRYNKNKKRLLEQFRIMTGASRQDAAKIFTAQGAIRKFELTDDDWDVTNPVAEYLNGMSDNTIFVDICSEYKGPSLPLEAHSIDDTDVNTIKSIISNKERDAGVNILLHGVPGTGKTEFCRSLAASLGKRLFELHSDDKESRRSEFNRYTAFHVCQNSVPGDESIILIDEADEMLNASGGGIFSLFGITPRNPEKNQINEILDTTKTANIWISNYSDSIDESTRRRFDYSIEFAKFTAEQRVNAWKVALKKHSLKGLITKHELKTMAKEFEVNPGGIDVALRNLKRLPKENINIESLKRLLSKHLELMNPGGRHCEKTPVKEYSLKGLNIKGDQTIDDAFEILTEFSDFMETPEYRKSDIRNMNLLLAGPPGTGKSEFVKYLAQKTGRGLVTKRAGDFLDKYVGETEKRIRREFKDAEAEGAILFIDEAEGLFFDRTNSQRGFESSRVNELLVAMENFNGILVCATNHKDKLDFASIRRFNLKFDFDYLDADGVQVFYDLYLAKLLEKSPSKKELAELAAIQNLTPGDFKVVKHKYAFFKKKKLSHKLLIDALADEVSHKREKTSPKIGFGA